MYEVGVTSDLYKVGITEEGSDAISERFFVMLEAPDGRRWNHLRYFNGSTPMYDEEDGLPFFPDNREEAKASADALAAKVLAHLKSGGSVDFSHWSEDRPRYGSEAYQVLDQVGHFRDLERKHDYERGNL
jgi:hypothetical protein